jgi:hypothetical protein
MKKHPRICWDYQAVKGLLSNEYITILTESHLIRRHSSAKGETKEVIMH